MDGDKQQTLKSNTAVSGIALHTGDRVNLALHPAPPNSGLCFRRIDLAGAPEVSALIENVVGTQRGTTIAAGEARVHTVEHLLAALNAMGVDNALIEMGGAEPPILDGSAEPFVAMIQAAGVVCQAAARVWLCPQKPLYLRQAETQMVVLPDTEFRITCTVKFGATPLDCQFISLSVTEASFRAELCAARTFCLYHEIEPLMAANLIAGGSLDNAVVVMGDAILSKEGLRYPDEFVRHKVLDIVGDLYLLGQRLRAQIIAVKPGHPSNVELARLLRQEVGMAV